ncbi:helix-turn-helix domain-containing protein [Sinomicrobium weinanense]|uniref:Helix-turn-helix transcriptional regulator n=1 Tax=Sinomicrobium weinanense TaxID=2842200 RepID=A0A926Q2P6_9FLAO|nr:helix-turn-helix transcriptional regulator [Sinomicrobium weinanense]MBC9794890.1 helix-turn-helix transcriptional regulator [Sinomicrobium weinanense]MBU3125661.1 helix-turn-helix transcriptional regulator [Sinomicrobium weinanense]
MKTINFIKERKKFGKHVLELRKKIKSTEYKNRSISQQELSDRSEYLSKKTIGEIERGETNPSFDTLLALTQVLDVSLRDLMEYR